jgi:ligand-binding sensor domain-containing protein
VVEVIDSVAAAVVENIVDTQVVDCPETLAIKLAVKEELVETGLPPVNDLLVEGSLVYAGFDGGLLIYDLKTQVFSVTPVEENLTALARHGGELFVGGEKLYRIDGADLIEVDEVAVGQINALLSYGPSLMIGSAKGLYAQTMLGCQSLTENVEISALVADNDGLWFATAGDGLFRWDGAKFKRRHLARDTSLFDNVTALDFNHDHLYVGTADGLYIYDGGRWQTVSTEQGLPAGEITALDASGWVVNIGTGAGLATYFENVVKTVDKMAGFRFTTLTRSGNRIIAGTAQQGLILQAGPSIKTLVEPWFNETEELAAMIF